MACCGSGKKIWIETVSWFRMGLQYWDLWRFWVDAVVCIGCERTCTQKQLPVSDCVVLSACIGCMYGAIIKWNDHGSLSSLSVASLLSLSHRVVTEKKKERKKKKLKRKQCRSFNVFQYNSFRHSSSFTSILGWAILYRLYLFFPHTQKFKNSKI